MSEVAARGSASRGGRGSARGGRGGYSSRGGRGGTSKTAKTSAAAAFEDQGEIGQLKSKYADSVRTVKEIFPQFTDEDVVVALEENGGDLEATINKISSGAVAQWKEAAKKKDKPKSSKAGEVDASHTVGKSGRSRGGGDGVRASRGRVSDRGGRGAARVAKPGPTTGTSIVAKAAADPAAETTNGQTTTTEGGAAWGTDAASSSTPATWDVTGSTQTPKALAAAAAAAAPAAAAADTEKSAAKSNGTRSWADLMKPAPKPKPAPVPVEKPAATSSPAPVLTPASIPASAPVAASVPAPAPAPVPASTHASAPVPVPVPVTIATPQIQEPPAPQELPAEPVAESRATPQAVESVEQIPPTTSPSLPPSEPAANIAPSEDKLTEENLEQVKDVSHPIATDTVASTVGTEDPRSAIGTPLHTQHAISKQAIGGFAATALKATQGPSRNASFHRKLKEQSEAVVMPGNHAVDRATVQFGSLGLGGSAEDIDDDREEPETRAQPPQHSPIAPRASLPAAPQASVPAEAPAVPRPAPGLTADASQAPITDALQPAPTQSSYDQFSNNRFGPLPGAQSIGSTSVSKSYEPFGQQLAGAASHPFDSYASHSQAPGQQSQNAPSYLGGFGGNDYGSYDYQRNQVYGGFNQTNQSSQETAANRTTSAFGSTAAEAPSQYATTHAPQNRFGAAGDTLNSGHSTPAPGTGAAGQSQNHPQTHHLGGGGASAAQNQAGAHGPYGNYYGGAYNNAFYNQQMNNQNHHQPYGRDRPAFDDARRYDDSYMNQSHHYGYAGYGNYQTGMYGGGGGAGGAGGGAGAGGKYGGPSQYGISPQTSYDNHNASSANAFGRESGPAGFGSYGRTGSTHPDSTQQGHHGASPYGAMGDPFGRNSSAFGAQGSQQHGQQGGSEEAARYGAESGKHPAGGPSPAPNQQRPGSATNTAQSGPGGQPQSQYGSYPHSGLGGFGGHQGGGGSHHQNYNNYGGGFGGPYYGGGRGNTWGYGAS